MVAQVLLRPVHDPHASGSCRFCEYCLHLRAGAFVDQQWDRDVRGWPSLEGVFLLRSVQVGQELRAIEQWGDDGNHVPGQDLGEEFAAPLRGGIVGEFPPLVWKDGAFVVFDFGRGSHPVRQCCSGNAGVRSRLPLHLR